MKKSVIAFPKLLILVEKHNTRYFLASSEEELADIAIKIVKERKKETNYYQFDSSREEKFQEQMLETVLRSSVDDKINAGKTALKFLRERSDKDYEYETFEVIPFNHIF
jgi:hypothetical protein